MLNDCIVYYAINNDPKYIYFAKNSVESLRKFNKNIKVYLFIYGSVNIKRLKFFYKNDVWVVRKGKVNRGEAFFLKWRALQELREKRILFVDADTIFHQNVALLFNRFNGKDFYARQEIGTRSHKYKIGEKTIKPQLNHKILSLVLDKFKVRKLPIFNTGVMLFNNHIQRKIDYSLFEFYSILFKAKKNLYPAQNPRIIDEIVASLVMGHLRYFKFGLFNKTVTPWYYETKHNNTKCPGVVMHIWTSFYEDYLANRNG